MIIIIKMNNEILLNKKDKFILVYDKWFSVNYF